MEPERKAFLRAIKADPLNYLPRYVYADWLDEHGEHEEATRQRAFEKADQWLRQFAETYIIGYEELIEGAVSGKGGSFGDLDGPSMVREPEFWANLEVVTGMKFTDDHRENTYFGCAC
jgi:uncharacterized protein (TIGR02996 family)